ncbi:hypothetical protein C8A01DRAFT_21179 [Parachaetomium inaequale]|uniref:Uncharacterized protein n=1 Tax=Parachaetomium inaequale TaxID=2588326 RepID=A0AAN6P6D9_9PEZI|nr:hypothetical protein C8A01DRAFT_21179 [Parachaetomium inaequale]
MSVRRASWEGSFLELRMLQAAMSETHLILHGPPDLPHNAEILGVCGVSTENADQNKYGWMVADFLHWKLLFHGTWLTSLDIAEFLKGVDGVDMLNDDTIYKFVGKHEDAIKTVPSDDEGFTAAFLLRLAESARRAVLRRTVLAVMVFAPVTPEQDICVDFGGGKKMYLTAERLRDTINNAVGGVQLRVVLVTPSPFTGGWLCRPSLMNRPACPAPDKMLLRIIAKSCGGVFADRSIRSFTERNTPLMTDAQRDKVKYDDPMPLRPSKLQTDCLHHFQRQIHESLEHRLSVFARDHAFILEKDAARDPSSFSDTWVEYGPREGRPLGFWAKHWGTPRPKIDHTHRFEFLGEAFGGTRESQFFHLKYLIAIELDTHPGDWERQVGGVTRELYTSFQQRLMPSVDDAKRVFDTIEFRASSAILAQIVAKAFDLPMPDGVKCRYWHDKMDGVDDAYYRKLQFAFGEALRLFDQAAVLPSERRHEFKNVRFLRAARWLSAATALKFENGSRQDIEGFVGKDVARLIAKIRDAQTALLLEDQSVTRAGLNWIAALGLGGEVQPIPGAANPEREDTGLTGRNGQRRTFTPALDAQAAPWPPKPIAFKPIERKWPTKRVAMAFADAESSLTQGDSEVKRDDTLLRSAKSDPLGPKSPGTNVQASRTHGEFGSDLASNSLGIQEDPANDEAVTWEKATSTPVPSSCATNGVAASETVIDTPIAASLAASPHTPSLTIDDNISAWDKILGILATSNGGQDEEQVGITLCNPSGDVHDLEDKKVDEPAPAPQTKPAAVASVEQAMKRLTESLMAAGMMRDSMDVDDNAVTRLLQKAAEMVEKEKAAKASGLKGEISPAENISYPAQANGNVNGTSGVSADVDSDWVPTSRGSVQDTRNGNEAARVLAEKTTTTLPDLPKVSSEVTMGHSADGHVSNMEGSGEPSENGVKTALPAAAEVTASSDQAAADSDLEVNLASGDDFWAKVAGKGIKF